MELYKVLLSCFIALGAVNALGTGNRPYIVHNTIKGSIQHKGGKQVQQTVTYNTDLAEKMQKAEKALQALTSEKNSFSEAQAIFNALVPAIIEEMVKQNVRIEKTLNMADLRASGLESDIFNLRVAFKEAAANLQGLTDEVLAAAEKFTYEALLDQRYYTTLSTTGKVAENCKRTCTSAVSLCGSGCKKVGRGCKNACSGVVSLGSGIKNRVFGETKTAGYDVEYIEGLQRAYQPEQPTSKLWTAAKYSLYSALVLGTGLAVDHYGFGGKGRNYVAQKAIVPAYDFAKTYSVAGFNKASDWTKVGFNKVADWTRTGCGAVTAFVSNWMHRSQKAEVKAPVVTQPTVEVKPVVVAPVKVQPKVETAPVVTQPVVTQPTVEVKPVVVAPVEVQPKVEAPVNPTA